MRVLMRYESWFSEFLCKHEVSQDKTNMIHGVHSQEQILRSQYENDISGRVERNF